MSRSRRPTKPRGLLAGVCAADDRDWLNEERHRRERDVTKFRAVVDDPRQPWKFFPDHRCDCGCNDDLLERCDFPLPAQSGVAR